MTEDQRLVLKIVASLLAYPGSSQYWDRLEELKPLAMELNPALGSACAALSAVDPLALQQIYVSAFDFDGHGSLYMTAHELGDSRSRGSALIDLGSLYQQAGFEVPDDSLADFLPLLLELFAVAPEVADDVTLGRIAMVARQIAEKIGPDHPYRPLFDIIPDAVSHPIEVVVPTVEENPDLTDLPFPVEY